MAPVKIGIYAGMLSATLDMASMQPLQQGGTVLATSLVVIPKCGEWV